MSEDKLTRHQKEILKQFRTSLSDLLTPHHTDSELLKWLRVRNFDLRKAERHFRQIDLHQKMYNVHKINEIYVKPKVLQEFERTRFLGFCKDGTPVRYCSFSVDFYGLIMSLSDFDISLYFLDLMKRDDKTIREENMKTGQNHDSIIYICDYEGFAFQDMSYKIVLEVALEYVRIFQEYYPEKWKYILYINAPYFLCKIVALFKPILKSTFLDRLKIVPKSTTLECLREYIDDDLIPASLGGKRLGSERNPLCKEFVKPYGKVPAEYYLKNSMHLISETDPGVEAVTIRARSCHNVSLVLKEAGSTIRTEFRTEDGIICFAILYRKFGSDPENPDLPASDEYIDPDDENSNVLCCGVKLKCHSHIAPNDGTCTAVWPGIYILHFDNTGSWFGSRKLYYRVTVTSPDT